MIPDASENSLSRSRMPPWRLESRPWACRPLYLKSTALRPPPQRGGCFWDAHARVVAESPLTCVLFGRDELWKVRMTDVAFLLLGAILGFAAALALVAVVAVVTAVQRRRRRKHILN